MVFILGQWREISLIWFCGSFDKLIEALFAGSSNKKLPALFLRWMVFDYRFQLHKRDHSASLRIFFEFGPS